MQYVTWARMERCLRSVRGETWSKLLAEWLCCLALHLCLYVHSLYMVPGCPLVPRAIMRRTVVHEGIVFECVCPSLSFMAKCVESLYIPESDYIVCMYVRLVKQLSMMLCFKPWLLPKWEPGLGVLLTRGGITVDPVVGPTSLFRNSLPLFYSIDLCSFHVGSAVCLPWPVYW